MSERPARNLWRHVAVPAEHGSWEFLAEPILLGLLVAPSAAGALVAVAALAVFLARRPLQIAVTDRRRGKRYPRTPLAERLLAACALASALAFAGALLLARRPFLLPVGLATPVAAVAVAFDLAQRPRALAPEIAGTLALAAASSAIALAGGWSTAPALALWAIVAARTLPSILYVRARLRLGRSAPADVTGALVAHAGAIALAAALAWLRLAPWLAAAAMAVLALRAAWGLSPWRAAMKTWQLGLTEIGFGLATVLAVAAGVAWGM